MTPSPDTPLAVPDPLTFRNWLQDSLATLDLSAARVAKGAGLGRNHVAEFLRDPARGLTLGSAHAIAGEVQAQARALGKVLAAPGSGNE